MAQPEYQIDPLQGQAGDATLFSAAARFPNDPFLARVGNIGRTKFVNSMHMAKEKCAAQVAGYLVKMVKEDEEWEDPEEKVEENIRKWEGMAATAAGGGAGGGGGGGVSELGFRVGMGQGPGVASHGPRLFKRAGADPFDSYSMCDFIPLEESVKIEREEEY
ncbi:hypothetical protein EMCG_08405 [[Emmonsia] crescens]|uniref:Uncharacterized protein n=1 Tax=[Emmonsia] crescens TaxID=73230 RepID=A0A0G2I6R4_9EURO|nr:hypothetical protein EMCG_08405 [Emmonsia crescens UAMH 3008]